MELILIEPDSLEWQYMWGWLDAHPINQNLDGNEETGEEWQYMGSYRSGERVIHEFRHKDHPLTRCVESLKVQASDGLTPEQITKSFRL